MQGEGDWVRVIAAGSKAMYLTPDGPIEVEVSGYRHTPRGLMYDLVPLQDSSGKWVVVSSSIQPIHGVTSFVRYNLITGESEPIT
jgi:hypothetical protein